jgi:hypothetical protein
MPGVQPCEVGTAFATQASGISVAHRRTEPVVAARVMRERAAVDPRRVDPDTASRYRQVAA